MAQRRADDALRDGVGGDQRRRLIHAIPQTTYDVGLIDITMVEGDQHLIIDLGDKVGPIAPTGHKGGYAYPGIDLWQEGEVDLDPSLAIDIQVINNPGQY